MSAPRNDFNTQIQELRTGSLKVFTRINQPLSDQQVKELAEILETDTTLEELELSNAEITGKGAEYLAEAIGKNKKLKSVALNYNPIDDLGMQFLATALSLNSTLTSFGMHTNRITDSGVKFFSEMLLSNTTLQILDLGSFPAGGLAFFGNQPVTSNIAKYQLGNNITAAGHLHLIEAVKRNKTIQIINLLSSSEELTTLLENNKFNSKERSEDQIFLKNMKDQLDKACLSLAKLTKTCSMNTEELELFLFMNPVSGLCSSPH